MKTDDLWLFSVLFDGVQALPICDESVIVHPDLDLDDAARDGKA